MTEDKNTKNDVSRAFSTHWVLFITAYYYSAIYFFESGYLSYYGIDKSFVEISVSTLLKNGEYLFLICVAVFALSNTFMPMMTALFASGINSSMKFDVATSLAIAIVGGWYYYVYGPVTIWYTFGLLALVWQNVGLDWMDKRWKSQGKRSAEAEGSGTLIAWIFEHGFGRLFMNFGLAIGVLLLCPSFGYYSAKQQTKYQVSLEDSTRVVVRVYGSSILYTKYNYVQKRFLGVTFLSRDGNGALEGFRITSIR